MTPNAACRKQQIRPKRFCSLCLPAKRRHHGSNPFTYSLDVPTIAPKEFCYGDNFPNAGFKKEAIFAV